MPKSQVVVVFPTYKEYHQKYIALGHVTVFKGPFEDLEEESYPSGFLNGIGGHLKKGETPEEAARREFNEEVEVSVNATLPADKLIPIGIVDVLFKPSGKEVELHVFRKYFPERVTIKSKKTRDFESFDWYLIQDVSCRSIGPNGAEILPSDRFWLPNFLNSKGFHHAQIEITNQFTVYDTGEGDSYKSGKMIISRNLHPSE